MSAYEIFGLALLGIAGSWGLGYGTGWSVGRQRERAAERDVHRLRHRLADLLNAQGTPVTPWDDDLMDVADATRRKDT